MWLFSLALESWSSQVLSLEVRGGGGAVHTGNYLTVAHLPEEARCEAVVRCQESLSSPTWQMPGQEAKGVDEEKEGALRRREPT